MSDYARANADGATHFGDKDALTTGDADKVIVGSQFDAEFNAIVTAVATKYDSSDLASQAEAEGEAVTGTLVSPASLAFWSDYEGTGSPLGMIGDLRALADPTEDALVGWDSGEAGGSQVAWFTLGTGLDFSDATVILSFLGLEALTDPDADSIAFWDDSSGDDGAFGWLTMDNGLEFITDTTTLGIADYEVSATQPLDMSSGTATFDISSLTTLAAGNAIAGGDLLFVDDGADGTNKAIAYQDFGIPVVSDGQYNTASVSMDDLNMANRWYQCNYATLMTVTFDAQSVTDWPIGSVFAFHQEGAGRVQIVVTTDDLRAPNGDTTNVQYSTVFVTKVATTEWVLTGDAAV